MRALLIALALLLVPDIAYARREATVGYQLSRVWTAAVRLIRVDVGCAVTEKDRHDGYLLFDYPLNGTLHSGSLEVFEVFSGGRRDVKVILQIQGMPSYVEMMLLDKLEKKLKADFGAPKEQHPEPVLPPAKPSERDGADAKASDKGDKSEANDGDAKPKK